VRCPSNGRSVKAPPVFTIGNDASASTLTTMLLAVTRPNTVKPPFLVIQV
jgi:hypothetical protein